MHFVTSTTAEVLHAKLAQFQTPPFYEDDNIWSHLTATRAAGRGLTGTSTVSRAAAQGLWGEEGTAAAVPDSIMEIGQNRIWNMASIPHPGLDAVLIPYSHHPWGVLFSCYSQRDARNPEAHLDSQALCGQGIKYNTFTPAHV